jgi:hypothetical protein
LLAWVDDEHADRALATYREYGATHPEAFETTGAPGTGDPEQATRVRAYHLWRTRDVRKAGISSSGSGPAPTGTTLWPGRPRSSPVKPAPPPCRNLTGPRAPDRPDL